MQISVYAGSDRFVTRRGDRVTHHSFSFGDHYDPDNVGFGPLLAHNDDLLSWGAGYPAHRHLDVEIVTWVLKGTLVHTDSLGNASPLPAGSIQVQSAGSGIEHSEYADTEDAPTRFVQCWLRPDRPGMPPARFSATGVLGDAEGLVPVAGADGGLPVGVAGATLWVGRLGPDEVHQVPDAPHHHLFVAQGSVELYRLEDEDAPGDEVSVRLGPGDAARITDGAELWLSTDAVDEIEVLLWTLP